MSVKKTSRLRRSRRARAKIRELGATRLSVHRSAQHIYAQIIAADGSKVLAQASTLDKSLRDGKTGNIEAASAVGKLVAERAVGVHQVDRAHFRVHGAGNLTDHPVQALLARALAGHHLVKAAQ